MPSLTAGQLVADRFEVLRPLGTGGLAEVYAARDRVTSTEVAIKILHAHLSHDGKLVERFRRELAAARGLDHPGIVRVFDLHTHRDGERDRPVLTMELLRGRTLGERLAEGPVPREEALRIARSIAEALHAAHRQGVIHRDLKPQNVMLCDDGTVKLLDFGLARAAGWARLTAQSTMLGTPSYMAPELFAGQGADPRADLYALGATLFEMLTGRPAFTAADPFQVVRQKQGAAPSARAVSSAVSAEDDALIRRALDPDPELRFLDAAQMVRALGGTLPAPPPPPLPRLAAGDATVQIHHGSLSAKAPVLRLLAAASGEKPSRAFWLRLRLTGTATLATGVSRDTAASLVALGQAHAVPSLALPTQAPGRWARALSKAAAPLGAAIGALVAPALPVFFAGLSPNIDALPAGAVAALIGAGLYLGAMTGLTVWLRASEGAPALARPRTGDPTVWRLLDGIARRVRGLRALADRPSPAQALAGDLAATADRLFVEANELAASAALVPDPLSSIDPDLFALPPGALEKRDAAVSRLLAIAAALDEATAAAAGEEGKLEQLDSALLALRSEASFAGRALPEIRDARTAAPPEGETLVPGSRQKSG